MSTIEDFIKDNTDNNGIYYPFFIFNVEDVIEKHKKWVKLLPRVIPYYAIKSNSSPVMLELAIGLDLKFDCASQYEIKQVLERGAKPENIIFANTCKSKPFIEYSKSVDIDLMTFDNSEELDKIYAIYPNARLVLRIRVEDKHSTIRLGLKFGADMYEVKGLLQKAKQLSLNVIGIAFHVGSGCQDSDTYEKAIQNARLAFNMGLDSGFQMYFLDIGGGFPGSHNISYGKLVDGIASFEDMAHTINKSLDSNFSDIPGLTTIAEPGRYYSESAFTLITRVLSKRMVAPNGQKYIMYYINDGIYGSFRDVVITKLTVRPIPLLIKSELNSRDVYSSVIWGSTLDSFDCIAVNVQMPELFVGDWIKFEDMGSYCHSFSQYNFNGMPSPIHKVYISENADKYLAKLKNYSKIMNIFNELK